MPTVMRFSQVLVLEMESSSRCGLNEGLDGGLDSPDLLNSENEVFFWESGLSSFVLDANSLWMHSGEVSVFKMWMCMLTVHLKFCKWLVDNICGLWLLKHGDLWLLFILCHRKLNIFGFWRVTVCGRSNTFGNVALLPVMLWYFQHSYNRDQQQKF